MERDIQNSPANVDFFENLTGDISKTKPEKMEQVGQRIRSIRKEKGLSLEELSNVTGFEVKFLSDIEKNVVQPQLGTVIKLSKALDSAFTRLISGGGDRIYSITRKTERKVISRSTSPKGDKKVYSYKSLAPEVKGRSMEALMVQLEENLDADTSRHFGEEFIYVLNGLAVLKIGDEVFELEPGDSAYYLSTTPHLIASKKGTTNILAVLYGG